MSDLTHYQVLQLHPTANAEAIRNAYFRLAKLYHPDLKHHQQKPEDTEKFIEINRAYTVLSNPEKRQLYDLELRSREQVQEAAPPPEPAAATARAENGATAWSTQREAGRAYFKAEQLVEEERFQDAARLLLALVRMEKNNASFLSLAGYALAQTGDSLHTARDLCRRAIEIEPFDAKHHARLAAVYAAAGLEALARRHCEEALKIDPAEALARRHLSRQRPAGKRGLLGSLKQLISR